MGHRQKTPKARLRSPLVDCVTPCRSLLKASDRQYTVALLPSSKLGRKVETITIASEYPPFQTRFIDIEMSKMPALLRRATSTTSVHHEEAVKEPLEGGGDSATTSGHPNIGRNHHLPQFTKTSPLSPSLPQLDGHSYTNGRSIQNTQLSLDSGGEEDIPRSGYTDDFSTSPRSSSPSQSPDLGWEDPTAESSSHKRSSRFKRPKTAPQSGGTNGNGQRVSPLAKRLGEEPPFMLPHPSQDGSSSNMYPGVVIGSFAGAGSGTGMDFGVDDMRFDGNMEDILDPAAASRPVGRHDSTSGQAGANIAPWLMDDSGPKAASPSPVAVPRSPTRKSNMPALSHFASVPSLNKVRRQDADGSSRSGSHGNIQPMSTSTSTGSGSNLAGMGRTSRNGSDDSMQTVSANQRVPAPETRHSGQPRGSRFGSSASFASTSQGSVNHDKKKGFLGGFLKRRAGASVSSSEFETIFELSNRCSRLSSK